MLAMGLLMDPLEALGLLEADPARLGGSDEAHRANKKYAPLVDPFPLDALQFVRQGFRSGIAQKGSKGGRVGPGLGDAVGLLERDHVGCGLLDNTETFSIQLAQDSGLSRARRAGQDEPLHPESLNLTAIREFPQFPQALCQSSVVMDFSDNTTFRPLIGMWAYSRQPSSSQDARHRSSLPVAGRDKKT
jgi:hypothetical protein